ncbi:MAG: gluconate 2-dehydrogenase subunit 3 family protein [Myxococcales bacterium]|nr:gluconate 2-dehydrogenase subunit 3 family protein [Myxococcales bacterium]
MERDDDQHVEQATGLSRRAFLRRGGLYGVGVIAALHLPRPNAARAAAESDAPAVLSPEEWRALEAATARVIPTDHEPGAREANCVNFIDKALAHEDAAATPLYRGGLAALDGVARARHAEAFAALEPAAQDAILADLEAGRAKEWGIADALPSPVFFETLRVHTIVGFLADPSYGGNAGYAGWQVAGYPGPRHRRGGFTPAQVEGRAPIVPVWER